VIEAIVCFGLGFLARRPRVREVVKQQASAVVAPPVATPAVERADSPFVMCRFQTRDGVVIAEKRLRRESITVPMMWGSVAYRLIASNPTLNRRTFERE
jgi:hypothetical protein